MDDGDARKEVFAYAIYGFVAGLALGLIAVFISKIHFIFLIIAPIAGAMGGTVYGLIQSNVKGPLLRVLLGGGIFRPFRKGI